MKFQELHDHIPYAKGGKEKVLRMTPYPGITLAMPGRHAKDTKPIGGDFVVMVNSADMGWVNHQFKHDDIFLDIANKTDNWPKMTTEMFMGQYLEIIVEGDPDDYKQLYVGNGVAGWVHPLTFLYAVQALAVAEHRRYAQHEPAGGGRFLPFRYAAGIAEQRWSAEEAIKVQKYGRPPVEKLEKERGTPRLTKELLSAI